MLLYQFKLVLSAGSAIETVIRMGMACAWGCTNGCQKAAKSSGMFASGFRADLPCTMRLRGVAAAHGLAEEPEH